MTRHNVGTREEWVAAREELLAREKEHTRLGDEIARQRRELPWVRLEKDYRLDTDDGEKPISELFDGRSQLLVYHFMFGPSYQSVARSTRRSLTASTGCSRTPTQSASTS